MTNRGLNEVERLISRAIGATTSKAGCPVGAHLWDVDLANAATAVREAIEQAGLVVVPREPTEAMVEAGFRAREPKMNMGQGAAATWEAMIAAAPSPNLPRKDHP